MDLTFERFNGNDPGYHKVTDKVSGKIVGSIRVGGTGFGNFGGMDVSLFDGKYRAELHKYDECVGFVRGVQAVLNHMTYSDD